VHKGTLVNAVVPEPVQRQSEVIESVFVRYLKTIGQAYEPAAMTGGSDYLPFLESGNVSAGYAHAQRAHRHTHTPVGSGAGAPAQTEAWRGVPLSLSVLHMCVCASERNRGIWTGASVSKTLSQRATFGGLARAQHDPCYHQDCDDDGNISEAALRIVRSPGP
jgi:hypothetical protein